MTAETYSVAELTRAISYALEDAFADDVWITGEISGLNRSRGHVYFDLVEPREQAGLAALVARFDDPLTTYLSRPRPKHVRFGRYDHLARVAEWSGGGEGAEDDA